MKEKDLEIINTLIDQKKIDQAQHKLSKLGPTFYENVEYLYLRSKIFYINKLYYIAIDTLLVALEFEKSDKVYNLIAKIYNALGNIELSKKIFDPTLRISAVDTLKNELSSIYKK